MNKITHPHPIEPEELMAYLDGELTVARAAAAEIHLGECSDCQRLVAELRSVSQTLNAWKAESPESAMPAAMANALADHRLRSKRLVLTGRRWKEVVSRRWPTFVWVGAFATILLVVVIPSSYHHSTVLPAKTRMMVEAEPFTPAPVAPPASAGPINGRSFDRMDAQLQSASPKTFKAAQDRSAEEGSAPNSPMIIRTAELSLVTKEFDKARAQLEAILQRHHGYVGELKVNDTTGSGRAMTATLRVPADQLDPTLTEVKTVGRVVSESQSGQDVTSQYVDLQARLGNARNTEQRLTDLLRDRTGKLSDVLEVEQELDRVRGQIEQMEAERKTMAHQVSFATLNTTITEDYKAQLEVVPPSTSTRLSNAAVDGYRSSVDGVVSLILFLLSTGPTLLLWGAILFFPARMVWRKIRHSAVS